MTEAVVGGRQLSPTTSDEARQIVQQAAERREPIYPVGGGTALEELLPKVRPGIDLSLAGLDRVVEFSPRDLTITVEAGVTLAKLAETVDEAGLLFPFASKQDATSTIGGLLATAWNGPRRTGWGNLRDYVIGVRAIDGRGVAFKSGGKVVKNVAGYDFCKLLVGSRGTLAVLTEATLRLKPRPERSYAESLTARAGTTVAELCKALDRPTIPYSFYEMFFVPMLPRNDVEVAVALGWEGPQEEMDAAKSFVGERLRSAGLRLDGDAFSVDGHLGSNNGLASEGQIALLVQMPPSSLQRLVSESPAFASLAREAPRIRLRPREGRLLAEFVGSVDGARLAQTLSRLRTEIGDEGYVTVIRDQVGIAPTRELRFGRTSSPQFLMDRVKATMDPEGILNPGRYVFADVGEQVDVD